MKGGWDGWALMQAHTYIQYIRHTHGRGAKRDRRAQHMKMQGSSKDSFLFMNVLFVSFSFHVPVSWDSWNPNMTPDIQHTHTHTRIHVCTQTQWEHNAHLIWKNTNTIVMLCVWQSWLWHGLVECWCWYSNSSTSCLKVEGETWVTAIYLPPVASFTVMFPVSLNSNGWDGGGKLWRDELCNGECDK